MTEDPFGQAAQQGNVDEIKRLLDRGKNIDAFDNYSGFTALIAASRNGHEAAVRLLLSRGANVNLADNLGTTALMYACEKGHLSIAELLLRSGTDHSLKDNSYWRTALMYACEKGYLSLVELLLRSGADHSIQQRSGHTALMIACQYGYLSIAELLLRNGANYTLPNRRDGRTPIDYCPDTETRAKIQGFIDSLSAVSDASIPESSTQAVSPGMSATEWDAVELEHAVQKAIAMKEKCWNRSKIMLVGQGRAGKSSLARVILGHDFNAESPSTCGVDKFEVNVSTGIVQNAQERSQCQWQEYKEKGSYLNNALASMAQNMAKLAVGHERQGKAELDNVDEARYVQVDSSNFAADDTERTQNQTASLHRTPDNIPCNGAESSPQIPPESASEAQQVSMSNLPFDISLIAKTRGVKDSDLLLSVFDFGGQEIFNCVHPFFLTENGAYVVVFNMVECLHPATRLECTRFLMFWVNSIAMHTKREITVEKTKSDRTASVTTMPDIYIVGTHRDQVIDEDQWCKIDELLITTLSASAAWPFVIKEQSHMFFPVDCKLGLQDAVARSLMQTVESRLKASAFVTKKRPLTWFSVLDDLEFIGLKQSMIELTDVEAIAAKYSIGKDKLFSMLKFFREMGVLLWYEQEGLRDAVILDPVAQFIIPVTRIICDPKLHCKEMHGECIRKFSAERYDSYRSSGVVDVDLLKFILSVGGENATLLIQMMQMYGLLVHWHPVQLKPDIREHETKYLVPSLFTESDAVNSAFSSLELPSGPNETLSNSSRTFFLVFSLDSRLFKKSLKLADLQQKCFLPTGFFEQLICKALVWSQYIPDISLDNFILHKRMAQLFFGNVKFWMILRSKDNCIQVDVPGNGQEAYSVHARLTKLVKEIISKTECSLHMEPFVLAGDSSDLFMPTQSIPVGAVNRPDNLLRSDNFDWICSPTQHNYVFDVFLSYRWNNFDSELVLKVFDHLQDYCIAGKKIEVFCDRAEFREGDAIQPYIFKSLLQTTVVVPIVSFRALERMLRHEASRVDNVLFEWLSSLMLIKMRSAMPDKIALEKIMPTMLPQIPDNIPDIAPSSPPKKLTDLIPCVSQICPTATVAAVLDCFRESKIDLPSDLMIYADTVTVDQILKDILGSIYAEADDVTDKQLPCRVAARAVSAIWKTEAFAWRQLDVMSLLNGRLETYHDAFVEYEVNAELLRECNLDDPVALPKKLGFYMAEADANKFLKALKKTIGRN